MLNQHQLTRRPYPSDLSHAQWEKIRRHLPQARSNTTIGGRPRTTNLKEVVNACLYQVRSGGAWRMLPHDFPEWQIVYHYFDTWKKNGTWQKIHSALYRQVRLAAGKHRRPSAAIIDSQSVQTTKKGAFAALTPVKRSKVSNDTYW
jgi:transposase